MVSCLHCVSEKSHFFLDYNSRVSWSLSIIFVRLETGMNDLHFSKFTYLIYWWHHSCETLNITEVQFMELSVKIQHVKFEDETFFNILWACKRISVRRLLNDFLNCNTIRKDEHQKNFCKNYEQPVQQTALQKQSAVLVLVLPHTM